MKNPEYMAFLYFPENYTREFAKHYINDSQNFDRNSLIFVHLTKESKQISCYIQVFKKLLFFIKMHHSRFLVSESNQDGFIEIDKSFNGQNIR